MVPAGTVVMSAGAQALALEQGILGPSSPIPTQCLLLKNMFDPKECAAALSADSCRRSSRPLSVLVTQTHCTVQGDRADLG